jgi:hypothetical protein
MDIEYLVEIYNQLYDHMLNNKMDKKTLFEICYFMENIKKIIDKCDNLTAEINDIKINYSIIKSKL